MLRVLVELWPITLPTAIYLLWHLIQVIRKRLRGESHIQLKDGPWMKIFLITVAVAIVTAITFGASQEKDKGKYTPATLDHGKVKDGSVAH